MASEMLTKFTLSFKDQELHHIYKREKTDFFNKSLIIVTIMIGALAVGLEVAYSQMSQPLPSYITILNWASFGVLMLITCTHRKCHFM